MGNTAKGNKKTNMVTNLKDLSVSDLKVTNVMYNRILTKIKWIKISRNGKAMLANNPLSPYIAHKVYAEPPTDQRKAK